MYTGLSLMNKEELAEITRLIGVDVPPSSREVLQDIVSGWIARAIKKEGRAQEEIERCVLEWTAESWGIIVPEGTDSNDLERALRLKIANDASEFLTPGWAVCCGLIAVGDDSNIHAKLDLMEEAAIIAVPSASARRKKRQEWESFCGRWSSVDPIDGLRPHLEAIKPWPELQIECLTLALSLSLLDGSISYPVEQLFRVLCEHLEIDRGASDNIKRKVSSLYWKHHNEAMPSREGDKKVDPVRTATHKTIYGAGTLEALAAETRRQLFASTVPDDSKKSGWSRLVGGLSGMSSYFSNRLKNSTHATLARVVYHTIVKQHDAVVLANLSKPTKKEESTIVPESSVEVPPTLVPEVKQSTKPPASTSSLPSGVSLALTEQMVDSTGQVKRRIQLDI